MAKHVRRRPDWLAAPGVVDIYSVSGCISENFADYVNFWRHNGYWLFDSPRIIQEVARENAISLDDNRLFYYEVYEKQYLDEDEWMGFEPGSDFDTDIVAPAHARLEGFDVVTFYANAGAECSPLSCNGLAENIAVNQHCLLPTLRRAIELLEDEKFANSEPGPYRVFAVHSVGWS